MNSDEKSAPVPQGLRIETAYCSERDRPMYHLLKVAEVLEEETNYDRLIIIKWCYYDNKLYIT